MINRDRIEGSVRNLRGRGKTALGAISGRPGQQVEGAIDQIAGAAQAGYGRARDTAEDIRRDGEQAYHEARKRGRAFADDARERGRAFADEAVSRGHHYRHEAVSRGRAIAHRVDENRGATLLAVAAAAFALGLVMRGSPRRRR